MTIRTIQRRGDAPSATVGRQKIGDQLGGTFDALTAWAQSQRGGYNAYATLALRQGAASAPADGGPLARTVSGNVSMVSTPTLFGLPAADFSGTNKQLGFAASGGTVAYDGDLTVSAWAYWTSSPSANSAVYSLHNTGPYAVNRMEIYRRPSYLSYTHVLAMYVVLSGGLSLTIYGSTTITNGAWHHVGLCRKGAVWSLFLDGVRQGTTSSTGSEGLVGNIPTVTEWIGTYDGTAEPMIGYVVDAVALRGLALFDGATCDMPSGPLA